MSDHRPSLDTAYALDGTEAARRLYADWAETYDETFVQRTGYRLGRRVAEIFAEDMGRGPVLDAGCGTGLIGAVLPEGVVVDGVDLSPQMLARARAGGRYRHLLEADLTGPLPLGEAAYNGLVSAGTFTHGHVGPEALHELARVLAPGAVAVVAANTAFARKAGLELVLDALRQDGQITEPRLHEEPIYDGPAPPEGHADDTALLVRFIRR